MTEHSHEKDLSFLNLLQCKCPRCRIGDMFKNKRSYAKGFMQMNDTCPVCGQYFDIEVGFYYGSAYVSYAFAVAISVVTFFMWWLVIGISANDSRVIYWVVVNGFLLLALQPYLMRVSRTLWLALFAKYDPEWEIHPAQIPERTNEALKNEW